MAIPEFRAIVALDPNNVDAQGNLGVLLFFQGAYADAIPPLRTALRLRPGLSKIQALLGIAEKQTGDGKTALADLEKSFPKLQEERIQIDTGMQLIEIYSGAGDLDKAAATVSALRRLSHECRSALRLPPDLFGSRRRIHADSVIGGSEICPHASGHGARDGEAWG